jgi:hypothetical protein
MMERKAISISELKQLQEQENKPTALAPEEVRDYAVAALVVLRGMTRGDKLRVLRQMRKLLG